ncbi:acetyl-CoA carboxylase biotin carboxyl carrier protein [Paracoccus sp. Z118]|uniref:acetyl-CoA carboxylase biotin carboxyl carrier protein n=1 Tax=Paracoccus sp. Z118 TaxID=2851017 RepID=UPI001C2BD1B5|nr:acetyl-CoA carboxylase biotin carboxyl carrier protein [Paracoccus sp. Z118]MBV0892767.1 acetyl-CoA carboxylase biotin carboxyl carrier protein [Paracoccus sp. Z118]
MSDKDEKTHESDVAFIQALAELLNRNELTELSVEREYGENDRLTVQLAKQGAQVVMQAQAPAYQMAPQMLAAPGHAPAGAGPAAAPAGNDPANLPGAVPSPMVGTVYLAPEPGAAPFVTPGQQVAEGDTLLIVEAMKTMNHIPAPRAGTVRRILVEDGTPVEFGTPLMIVE